jgi:hypothetical protein
LHGLLKAEKYEHTFLSRVSRLPTEHCFLKVLVLCPSGKNSMEIKMSLEQWLNDADRGYLKYWQ